jgi:uncharacterized membrane protein (DUF4010 family)
VGPDTPVFMLDCAIALALGLLVGMEREHHETEEGRSEVRIGARTFALLALLGGVVAVIGDRWEWLPPAAFVSVALGVFLTLRHEDHASHGLTTEVAALVTFGIGLAVHRERLLAVALAVATTFLLVSKPLVKTVAQRLRRVDLVATLQLALLLAVVLPLLPVEPVDPWASLSPRRVGLLVTLILGIDYVGYVLARVLGAGRGAVLTGIIGGIASSTAVTAAMAQEVRAAPELRREGQVAIFLASAIMCMRATALAAAFSRGVAAALAPALGPMALSLGLLAWWARARARRQGDTSTSGRAIEVRNPMSIVSALKWAALLSSVILASAAGRALFGAKAIVLTAMIAGVADVDPVILAVAPEAAAGATAVSTAALAVLAAVATNTAAKAVLAWVSGRRAFGIGIAAGFAIALAVGAAGLAVGLAMV